MALRRKQRSLLRAIDNSPVRYSRSPGISLENPVVITGAGDDMIGSMAVFAWLIKKRGTKRSTSMSPNHSGSCPSKAVPNQRRAPACVSPRSS